MTKAPWESMSIFGQGHRVSSPLGSTALIQEQKALHVLKVRAGHAPFRGLLLAFSTFWSSVLCSPVLMTLSSTIKAQHL